MSTKRRRVSNCSPLPGDVGTCVSEGLSGNKCTRSSLNEAMYSCTVLYWLPRAVSERAKKDETKSSRQSCNNTPETRCCKKAENMRL
jgi:hypothetical protein